MESAAPVINATAMTTIPGAEEAQSCDAHTTSTRLFPNDATPGRKRKCDESSSSTSSRELAKYAYHLDGLLEKGETGAELTREELLDRLALAPSTPISKRGLLCPSVIPIKKAHREYKANTAAARADALKAAGSGAPKCLLDLPEFKNAGLEKWLPKLVCIRRVPDNSEYAMQRVPRKSYLWIRDGSYDARKWVMSTMRMKQKYETVRMLGSNPEYPIYAEPYRYVSYNYEATYWGEAGKEFRCQNAHFSKWYWKMMNVCDSINMIIRHREVMSVSAKGGIHWPAHFWLLKNTLPGRINCDSRLDHIWTNEVLQHNVLEWAIKKPPYVPAFYTMTGTGVDLETAARVWENDYRLRVVEDDDDSSDDSPEYVLDVEHYVPPLWFNAEGLLKPFQYAKKIANVLRDFQLRSDAATNARRTAIEFQESALKEMREEELKRTRKDRKRKANV